MTHDCAPADSFVSVFDLFKIGIGPSSSHTVGPMIAARQFAVYLRASGVLAAVHCVTVELFGSLSATGIGHGTDRAVLLGLAGHEPDRVDPEAIAPAIEAIRSSQSLSLLGQHPVRFVEKEHLLMRRKSLPLHPNGMRFAALGPAGEELLASDFYSIGGGFVVDASGQRVLNASADAATPSTAPASTMPRPPPVPNRMAMAVSTSAKPRPFEMMAPMALLPLGSCESTQMVMAAAGMLPSARRPVIAQSMWPFLSCATVPPALVSAA